MGLSLRPLSRFTAALVAVAALAAGCADAPDARPAPAIALRYWGDGAAPHASTIALTPGAREAVVVHPDSDTVAFVDLAARALVREVALGPTPALERGRPIGLRRWRPSRSPSRPIGAWPTSSRATPESSSRSTSTRAPWSRARRCATSPRRRSWALERRRCSSRARPSREVLSVNPVSLRVLRRGSVPHETGALALHDDGGGVYVTHPLTGGVTLLDARTLAVRSRGAVAPMPYRGHPIRAHGLPRALVDAAVRPGARELWVLHTLFSDVNAQPVLNFKSTMFPR